MWFIMFLGDVTKNMLFVKTHTVGTCIMRMPKIIIIKSRRREQEGISETTNNNNNNNNIYDAVYYYCCCCALLRFKILVIRHPPRHLLT